MKADWAVRFPRANAHEASILWSVAEVEVCTTDEHIWFRGPKVDEQLGRVLKSFWAGQRFTVLVGGQLRAPGTRVPHGHLPEGPWMPLRAWMKLACPRPLYAGRFASAAAVRLERSATQRPSAGLLTTLADWQTWGPTLPRYRLARLRFAVSRLHQVIVLGDIGPALPGRDLTDRQRVLVPAGYDWVPRIDADVLRRSFQVPGNDYLLWLPQSGCQVVPEAAFVAATRHSIHVSARGRSDESDA